MSIIFWFFLAQPILGMLLVPKFVFTERNKVIAYALLLGAFFGYLAYFIDPSPTIDLARYFEKMEMLTHFSLNRFLSYYDLSAQLDLSNWFFFGISKLNDVHLMPLIVMFFVYSSVFYMILDNRKRNNVSNKLLLVQMFVVISFLSFPGIASNIRNISAFVFFMLGFYFEVYHEKNWKKVAWLYLVAILIHKTAVILILLRVLAYFINRWKSKKILITICLIFLLCSVSIVVVYRIIHVLPVTIPFSSLIDKAYSYATGFGSTDDYMVYIEGSLFMRLQKMFFLIVNLLFLYIFIITKQYKNIFQFSNGNKINQFSIFTFLVLILTIGTIPITLPVYWRFSLVTVIYSWSFITKDILKKQNFLIIIMSVCIGGLLYQALLLAQFTDISQYMIHIFTNNYFSIFFGR